MRCSCSLRRLQLHGSKVVLEDPGYGLFYTMLQAAGAEVLPQPVDSHGLDPLTLPHASLAIVTPSRHYPLGFSMPLARRLDLIEWADRHEAFIVEDDFDSEYRYRGTPLPAMMGLRDTGRVIYLGSFSKVFSPALRLGYLVLPPAVTPKVMQCLRHAVQWRLRWPSLRLPASWHQAASPPTSGACAVPMPRASRRWSRRWVRIWQGCLRLSRKLVACTSQHACRDGWRKA
jgi:histidinol-phosphate/aromatic aminotransferase/cobyric acid decarboxylase-like protein